MNISELKSKFLKSLEGLYPSEEVQSFFTILSEKYLLLTRIEIALNPKKKVSEEDVLKFQEVILRLKNHEPIQYIIGETEFYGLLFKVNEHTLIPRPETEELVAWVIYEVALGANSVKPLTILDIGTGSGCIAISLAKNLPNSKVHALDISSGALKIAGQNAEMNDVEIEFFQTDVLNAKSLPTGFVQSEVRYDVIVSNPPYVREMEKGQMQRNVLEYEPETALFVTDDDPLLFYKTISRLAAYSLKPNGQLFFEINEHFGNELKTFLKGEGFQQIEVRRDIYGKDRMLKCRLLETR